MDEGRIQRLATEYRRFSVEDTPGRSELYAELTRDVAGDRQLLEILCELEPAKRQPNLLLAAVRHLYGDFARDWPEFRRRFFARQAEVLEIIRTHRTQTNEPARCAARASRSPCWRWARQPDCACCPIATAMTSARGAASARPP